MVKVTAAGSITGITTGGEISLHADELFLTFGVLCSKSELKFSKGLAYLLQDSVRRFQRFYSHFMCFFFFF